MSALDSLTTLGLVIFLTFVSFGTTLSVGVTLAFVILLELDSLLAVHLGVSLGHAGESFTGRVDLGSSKAGRELDFEKNEQVSSLVTTLVEGETLVDHSHNLIGLDHESRSVFDSELGAVEVGDDEVNSGKSLEEGDLFLNEQVSSLTLESLVR